MKDHRRKDFASVGSLVSRQVANQMGDPETAPEPDYVQDEIRRRWGRCAGRAADASFPLLFRSGRLVIFTESAIWATELRHQQNSIREELKSFNINQIEVKARPGIMPSPVIKRRNIALSDSNRRNLRSTASRVQHPGLRSALNRLAEKKSG